MGYIYSKLTVCVKLKSVGKIGILHEALLDTARGFSDVWCVEVGNSSYIEIHPKECAESYLSSSLTICVRLKRVKQIGLLHEALLETAKQFPDIWGEDIGRSSYHEVPKLRGEREDNSYAY